MNNISQVIITIAIVAAVSVGAYLGFQFLTLKKAELVNAAKYQCSVSSSYSVKDGNATVSYPVKDLYDKCLKETGIK